MLIDALNKIANPQTTKDLFTDNEQSILYDRLTASLREAAVNIKEQMKTELETISTKLVSEAVGKIRIPRNGIDGRDGKGIDGVNGINGKDAVVDENKIIAEVLKKIPPLSISRGKMGGGGSTMRVDNLSSQANGSTKTFTTTYRIGSAHLLFYSSFPTLFLPTTDYSVSGNTITLGASVNAPVSGQSLAAIYESSD